MTSTTTSTTTNDKIDLQPLRNYCKQVQTLFYEEAHYFPRPLETLYALFGKANCRFSSVGDMYMLRLKQSELTYSAIVPAGKDAHEWMARAALDAMPLCRVTDMLCEMLIYKDPTLACDPFTVHAARAHVTLMGGAGRKRKLDCEDDHTELVAQIAAALKCSADDVLLEDTRVRRGAGFWKSVVCVAGRRYEPHVYCKSLKTAQSHALLNALCMVKQ